MGNWFARPSEGIDALAEFEKLLARDSNAAALLAAKIAEVQNEPGLLQGQAIPTAREIGVVRVRKMMAAYRLRGVPPKLEVLGMDWCDDTIAEGKFTAEVRRRNTL